MSTANAFAAQLAALLPRGQLWAGLLGSPLFRNVLQACGDALARVQGDIDRLPVEADPRTTADLLVEWESTVGLPDGCLADGGSIEQRRAAVVSRLVATGGASEDYFLGLAAAYGYTGAISYPALHTWRFETPTEVALINATCNGNCNDALQSYGNEQLECLLNRAKPAHTVLEIAYGV
ncbi:DUF2313 domain-containing protein [Stagnimonas aquatica]|uniref:DUF2313 domain-containing protein n=1 Tax=Stagnimonas aquatica TaxID=2689987 RepID=A0A3N0V7W6_9GAMM|nr:putative phage tail protein [Stagnimonas aquatica]ROH88674.1 DUF2313 domain-containing protein [Stagnimonas aquatica]